MTKESNEPKKTWSTPKLTIHGDVEEITTRAKVYGSSDGMAWNGHPITTLKS